MTPDKIKTILNKLCKNESIPKEVVQFIDKNTMKYGTVKLFLSNNKYLLEVFDENIIKKRFFEDLVLNNIK